MTKDTYVLGLAYFGQHDSAAALLKNGRIIAAAEEERFTRVKFDRSFPKNAIAWCLKSGGITIDKVLDVGYFWKPWKGITRVGFYRLRGIFEGRTVGVGILKDFILAEPTFRKSTGYKGNFHYLEHHIAHATSSFYASGFKEALIISMDGRGESETCWLGVGEGNKLTKYSSTSWPHSLGYFYSTATQFLGFEPLSDEYKVMALGSYGKPKYIREFRKILKRKGDVFSLDLSYFSFHFGRGRMFSDKWIKRFGSPRSGEEKFTKRHYDIAASVQLCLEEMVLDILGELISKTSKRNLCLSGGVFLNSVLVGKIANSGLVERVYTTPASGDTGCALGAAYYVYRNLLNNNHNTQLKTPYLGSKFSERDILNALEESGLKYKKVDSLKLAPTLLSRGHVVARFFGGSEFGQRALGNRSILADPRDKRMRDKVNRLVKYRERFRPFAPAVLKEYQNEYFECSWDTPYMTEVHKVVESKRKIIPAVVHVDGTARLQTVSKQSNLGFWKLINNFKKITGVPILLNTSFNVKGEPIVDSPKDAIRTFLNSGIDDLFLGDFWTTKKG